MIKQIIEGLDTTKYMFFNGTEISFKRELSAQYEQDFTNPAFTDKGKYSLVLSCSMGCNIGCEFCHLTQNQKPTKTLPSQEILQNIKEVIADQTSKHPLLKNKAIKLCWMGEGEPLLQTQIIKEVTTPLLSWVFENNHAKYLDGVDIATSYPKVSKKRWTVDLKEVHEGLLQFNTNPNQDVRSVLRLFYSLHNSIQKGRDKLIPISRNIDTALTDLKIFCEENEIDFIVHYMFIQGITDSGLHLLELIDLWRKHKLHNTQLRILRYNAGVNGWVESEDLDTNVYWLRRNIPNLKVQYSSGKEIKSSCGMFTEYSS